MRQIFIGLLALALIGHSTASWGSSSSLSTGEQAGYGAGAVLGTLVYWPFKATFCILGGIGSAFTAIASVPAARRVVGASCGGTWVITPGVVQGHENVKFVGDTPPERAAAAR